MRTMTIEEHEKQSQARKKKLKLMDWKELESAQYPTYFTAMFTYSETGEGLSYGVYMGYAHSVSGIQRAVTETFGYYYEQYAEIALGLVLLPGYRDLVPKATRQIMREIKRGHPYTFRFHTVQHTNFS